MKLLVALCLMAAGVSAQYGESGIVHADGTLQQFTPEEAANVAEIGESGVVFHDGSHKQFDMEFAAQHNNLPAPDKPEEVPFGPYGYHGIVMPDGVNKQFTAAEHENVVVVGPSGAVTKSGNIQFSQDGLPLRRKRAASGALVGSSGYFLPDGTPVQLAFGEKIIVAGSSGIVKNHGRNVQFDRKKREVALEGPSGVQFANGALRHLAPGVKVVVIGPSGATLSDGSHVQFRKKRAAPSKATLGESGIITPGGRLIQLPHGVTVVLEGPSAALLSNGDYVQYEF